MLPLVVYAILSLALVSFFMFKIAGFFKIPNLRGRPVFITGCDRGFGNAATLRFLSLGLPVFAGCHRIEGAQQLKERAKNLPGKLETVILDVANQKSVDEAKEFVNSKVSGLWALVNNAGILGPSAPDDWLDVGDYQKVLDVNVFGVIRVTHAFKDMIKNRKGRIIAISSTAGRVGVISSAPYVTSKHAIEGYFDTLRLEMRDFGVSVHILEPGVFSTDMIDKQNILNSAFRAFRKAAPAVREEYGESYAAQLGQSRIALNENLKSTQVDAVVKSYEHAVTSRFPQIRYRPGFDSYYLVIPSTLLPGFMQDLCFIVMAKICKVPVPRVLKK